MNLRRLWHQLTCKGSWLCDTCHPLERVRNRFPKRGYFLDGLLQGKTLAIKACLCIEVPVQSYVEGRYYRSSVRYIWDTAYNNAEVAYLRLAPPGFVSAIHRMVG